MWNRKYNPVSNSIVLGQKIGLDEDDIKVDATLYKQIVGSLMYVTSTRPYLMFVGSLISHFMACPKVLYFAAAKRVLSYLKGKVNYDGSYKREQLVSWSDSVIVTILVT